MCNAHAATTSVHENEAFGKRQHIVGLVERAGDFLPGLDEPALDVLGRGGRRTVMRAGGEKAII